MATGRFVAYYRVSTARQGRSGLGLEAQREAVGAYLNGGDWKLIAEVTEIESGKRSDRPELARALALCRVRNATLVIAKLDRLSRNLAFIANLMESGVEFVAVDLPVVNKLTLHILAAVAESEREAISQRTKVALARAKARGVVLGGDRGNLPKVAKKGSKASAAARSDAAAKRAKDLQEIITDLRREGASSLRQIAAGLTEREISPPRGGAWSATQVARVLRQAA
ncbi:resolvase [Vineibacter terrae]|uniref:Resolvase n=1 Tax=Vineibacter terrae TaxID=2586908 RepID=A0A5C8PBB1_9HYPH|nr:recombinase family protein [Vineibacter terrae]TXL70546.1 resolvase [Vineibacter terrae]